MFSDFGRNAARPDGLSFYCLACNRARNQAFYARKRETAGLRYRPKDNSPDGLKRCARCLEVKPTGEFHKTAATKDGFVIYCKSCRKERDRVAHLRRKYGLSAQDVAAIVDSQNGLCAVCETRPAVHVDHDHGTGAVRGVLCFMCNVALGHLKDDVQLFRKAIDYLERTRKPS